MPTTYDLLTAAARLLATSADYDSPEAFDAALTAWLGEGTEKLARIAAWFRACAAAEQRDAEQRDAYAAAVLRHRAHMRRAVDMTRDLLLVCEELTGEAKVPGVARLQRNGGKAPLLGLDVDTLPDDLVIVTRVPDTEAVRAALAAGREVPGVTVGEPGRHVRFE